ncbi:hypothetical protein BY458DRAFT_590026 [Sporodiniella umbellata]|nr:hypothetical protein BY458DRAFT_590026 [Sporodiniella umbellata]
MTPTTEEFNSHWDIIQEDNGSSNADLFSPFNELGSNEPAVLTPQPLTDTVGFIENTEDNKVMTNQIQVIEPRKETEQQSTFISYLVTSNKKVRRRFQDFVWLHNVLYTHFPACFVPPLPDKHRLEYVKGDRFSQDFIEKRRVSLERFIQRIARHPILGKAELFVLFLESSEFNNTSERALRESQETMIDTIGDTLLNAFTKIHKRDPRFVEMKEKSDRMEENLDLLQRTLMRTHRRLEELCGDYEEFQTGILGLSEIESADSMQKFASILNQYNQQMKKMTASESQWQMEVYDYMLYYRSIKSVLKLRDQKQLDHEELSNYYRSTVDEKERLIQNRKEGGVASFISDKINEVRGADSEKIKREKILRLDERMREVYEHMYLFISGFNPNIDPKLKDAVSETQKVSTAFSDQVKKEDMFFNRNKSIELFETLKSYTDSKVTYFSESTTMWKEFIQSLENTL